LSETYQTIIFFIKKIGSFGENIISIPPKKISSLQKHDFPAARKLRFAFCGVAGYSVVNNKRGW
jgi:hypothetical protein